MGDRYWVLPARLVEGHVVSGFASRDARGIVRILLYTHHAQDTQSRSDASFDLSLNLDNVGGSGPVAIKEYRFDREHNSPFPLAKRIRDRPATEPKTDTNRLAAVARALEGNDRGARLDALASLSKVDAVSRRSLVPALFKLAGQEQDLEVRAVAKKALEGFFAPAAYSRADIEEIQKACECHATTSKSPARRPDGRVQITTRVAGNGCTFLTIEPDQAARAGRKPIEVTRPAH
jgi:hypothetical protein